MDGAMGKEEEVVEAVLTCEGDFHDPELLNHLEKFRLKLTDLLLADEARLNLKKVEPWNSVKVTFTIPREAALRLRQLAQVGNESLRQLGVLSVQIQGDSSISLKIVGRNNETTEFMLHTSNTASSSLPSESGGPSSEISPPGPSNEEVTRKNIVDYLIQGPPTLRPNAIFNSILGTNAPITAPFLGANRGVPTAPDSFPGVGSSRPILRPNSMANVAPLPNPALRGSHSNNFPFAKTSGAFHIPIPHQTSAGQSTSDFPNLHTNSLPVNNTTGLANSSGFQHSGTQQKNNPGATNVFGPIGAKLSASSNISNNLPPSSSPGFMIDLPPPPPYPHSSPNNSNKSGKQVSATSPLLVNLLQTDPIAVAAGMTGATSSKTVTVGNTSPAPPAKKKKRSKKPKESVSNSFSNLDDIHNKDVLSNSPLFNPSFSTETARIPDPSASFSSKLQKEHFPGNVQTAHSFSNIHRHEMELKSVSDKSFKPLISSDRPFSENSLNNSAFSLSKFNTGAIGTDHVRSNEINGPRELSQELIDSFSKEIAAGKIINPYTGQLEPRDSLSEVHGGKFKEDVNISRVFSNKGREMGNSNFSDVPVSVSQMMDINVMRGMSTVSSSTAALFHSGSTLHMNEKHPSHFPPHRRNFSDSSVSTHKHVYAAKLNSKSDNENFISSISSTLSQSTFNPHLVSTSSLQNQMKGSNSSPVTGPGGSLTKVQTRTVLNQHVQSVIPPHTVPSPLLSSGVSESVINSISGSSCSSTTLPVTQKDSFVKHLEHNPSLFQLTSCANSNTQSSVPHHSHPSKMFSSSSQNVVQTRPVLSQAQSSLQASGRLISSDVSKSIPSQHVQAASSDPISCNSKTSFPNLLNSLPEKSHDQQGMLQSPLEKVSAEGDDNSNHSGLVSENLPENSGTSVLLEHTGVKAENHDSGVGSSSERSDDTPSEPGDGEFRANNNCSESEDVKSTKKLVNYKADVGSEASSTNTITVGYMMSSIDSASHLKSSQIRDKHEDLKTTTVSLPTSSKLDNCFDTQANSLHKQIELSSSSPVSSADWTGKEAQMHSSTYSGKIRQNGPLDADKEDGLKPTKKEFQPDSQLNGPSSKEVDEILLTIAGLQEKDDQIPSKNSPALKRHGLHLQQEVLEEMAKLQQLAASKELANIQGKLDKEDPADSLHRSLGNNEDRHDQLPFFDMEDLVNGKLFGNGTSNVDNKTGSNITSIYSKRSSPVNVNMLNHIYAPGLPLPRRLTESVQRLVKPLPASESSMPPMRLCKSPGAGSPRAGTSPNGPNPSRMALLSGTRSPGSSIPKLFPNDKHSLLSGGLDLAGLSKFPPNSLPLSDLTSENLSGDASSQMLGLATDLLSRDGHSHGLLSCHVSPPLLTDSLANTQKMLSQSFPPHKSRDLSNSVSIHDLFSRIQQPHQSLAESLQDSCSHPLRSHSDSTISSHQSQTNLQKNQHSIPNSVSQSESFPLSTFSHSSHTRVTSTETIAESALSKNSKTTYSSLSSPNHSRSASPTTLANSNILESSVLSKTNTLAFKTAPEAGSGVPNWGKISLNNGSKSSPNQKIAVSSQKNVPYVTLSSSSVAGPAMHSAQSVSSRISPAVCSALLSGPVIGNSPNSSIDKRAVLKSPKPDLCSPSRTVNKEFSMPRSSPITSALSRNLFESVSCDLTTMPHSVVQTSRNNTLDTLVSHSSSKSVLDLNHAQDLNIQSSKGQRKNSDSSQGHISPQLNFHSDINSLQSIRTNETPSTSLPAQVVHLDFPHFPPTVSETPISNTVADHVLPVSQKLLKSPVTSSKSVSHNWNSTLTNPITSAPSFPAKTSTLSKVNSPRTTVTSLTLDKKDHQIKNVQRTPSPPLVKEPILETLASALGSSLKKVNEEQNRENKSITSSTSNSASVAIFNSDEKSIDSKIIATEASSELKRDTDTLASASEQNTSLGSTSERLTLKRGSHLMEQSDEDDGCSAAKRFAVESTNKCETVPTTNNASDEKASSEVIDTSKQTVDLPKSDPSEQKKEIEMSVSALDDSKNKCSDNGRELTVSVSTQGSLSDLNKSIDVPQCDIKMPVTEGVEDKNIPISSTNVSSEKATHNLQTVTEQTIPGETCSEQKSSHEAESRMGENSEEDTNFNVSMQSDQISLQGVSSNDQDTALKDEDQKEKQIMKVDVAMNMTESKDNQLVEDTLGQNQERRDGETNHDQDSTVSIGNAESKLDDASRKGHRVKRQFYAYVPEKSIDQTYFDTPILTGRTRSRNKPSDAAGNPENAVIQEGTNATSGSSDSQTSAVTSGVKTEVTDLGNKRSTRSLRTKDNSQDLTANKRRRLQTRDHR